MRLTAACRSYRSLTNGPRAILLLLTCHLFREESRCRHERSDRRVAVFAIDGQLDHRRRSWSLFHVAAPSRRSGLLQLDQPARRARAALDGRRLRHQPRLPPPAHAPRLQDLEGVRVFPRGLRHADARGRADFLGRDAPRAPSALRPRRRSAHAARRRLLGAHGLDPVRRHAPQQHGADGASTRPTSARIRSTAG